MDENMRKVNEKQNQMMDEYGWVVHYVIGAGAHSHGLRENFGHADLECKMNIEPKVLQSIFSDIVAEIKNGHKFLPGISYPKIIGKSLNVTFVTRGERLRLILPDKDGNLKQGDMDPIYAAQFEGEVE